MPRNQGSNNSVQTEPSLGFLQRWFGSEQANPTVQQGIALAQKENPNLGNVQPYGFFSRLLHGNDEAYTSPSGTIYANMDHFRKGYTPNDVATMLAHEQSHVQQVRDRGLNPLDESIYQAGNVFFPYHRNPDEVQAYSNDVARARSLGLSDPPIPDFVTGEMRAPLDRIDTAPSALKRRKV